MSKYIYSKLNVNINVKNCSLNTLLTATDRKQQKLQKGNIDHNNTDIHAMLLWLIFGEDLLLTLLCHQEMYKI